MANMKTLNLAKLNYILDPIHENPLTPFRTVEEVSARTDL
jgi:hypothetical protein